MTAKVPSDVPAGSPENRHRFSVAVHSRTAFPRVSSADNQTKNPLNIALPLAAFLL